MIYCANSSNLVIFSQVHIQRFLTNKQRKTHLKRICLCYSFSLSLSYWYHFEGQKKNDMSKSQWFDVVSLFYMKNVNTMAFDEFNRDIDYVHLFSILSSIVRIFHRLLTRNLSQICQARPLFLALSVPMSSWLKR